MRAAALLVVAAAACGDDAPSEPEVSCDRVAEHVVDTFSDKMIDETREASLTRVQATCAGNRMPQSVRRCILDAGTMEVFIGCTEAWAQPLMEDRRQQEIERLRQVREKALEQKRELEALDERLRRLEGELEAAQGAIDEVAGDAEGEGEGALSGDAAGGRAP